MKPRQLRLFDVPQPPHSNPARVFICPAVRAARRQIGMRRSQASADQLAERWRQYTDEHGIDRDQVKLELHPKPRRVRG